MRISPGERGEYNFDLVAEVQGREQVVYYFVLTHSLEDVDTKQNPSSAALH
ncbi:hypothetical protein QT397_20130 [Microbulbifer sp. MKSA007]|nr:hypothetical protein QT397_20130 [Microbulbifer sp. MKSA007]